MITAVNVGEASQGCVKRVLGGSHLFHESVVNAVVVQWGRFMAAVPIIVPADEGAIEGGNGSRVVVLLQVGSIDGVLHALTSRAHGADGDLSPAYLNSTSRLLEERPIPTARSDAPRPDEHATVHHHGPDTDQAVRLGAGPDAEHLLAVDGGEGFARETVLGAHRPGFRIAGFERLSGSAPDGAELSFRAPAPAPARHDGQVFLRSSQCTSFAPVARVAEELPVAWGVGTVRPLVEVGAHEPAMCAGGGLVDATDAPPADRPAASSLHGCSAREVICMVRAA